MISIKRILVPVDFSDPSTRALACATSVANIFGARLVVAHILADLNISNLSIPESGAFKRTLHEAARKDIDTLIRSVSPAAQISDVVVRAGEIQKQLLDIVDDHDIDLVVMGTHGRSGPRRWFLGSVTETILRKMPVPILTVSHSPHLVSIRKLLYATDLNDDSRQAFRSAADFSRTVGAELTVLHVVQHMDYLFAGTKSNYFRVQRSRMVKASRRRLSEFVTQETPAAMSVQSLILEGHPYRQILETARKQQSDLIVMHPGEKSAADRALLGATAEFVVRGADVPVLSIPLVQGGVCESRRSRIAYGVPEKNLYTYQPC
jgi:nucleotide-binding universal stress UspA family protein